MRLVERPTAATRLVLIRHAEPHADSRGRCYGRLDVGLSKTGSDQAAALAAALADMIVDVVVSSPRRRAVETARPLAVARSLEVVVHPAVSEIDFGELEGRTYEEIQRELPEVYATWMEHPTEVVFPGGESYTQMRDRVLAAVHRIRGHGALRTTALVSHGGTNRVILADALGIANADIFRIDQSYGALNVIDYFDEFPLVRSINATV